MNKVLSLFMCFQLFCLLCSGQKGNSAVADHGKLTVIDGRLVDRNHTPPQLRGISFSWSVWGGRKYYNEEVLDWLVDDFNVNIVRLSMGVQPAGGYLQNPEEQKKLITRLIDKAIARGIYVIVDWHDHNANLHKKEAKLFFEEISRRYAQYPNIIYEIWNEPERQSWNIVKDYAGEIISVIRKNDSSNVIVVGCPHWDQDIDVVADDPLAGFSNLVYSFHFYASDKYHQEGLMNKAETALSKKLPLMVTEWGVGEANGNGVFDHGKTEKWFAWMENRKLSWVNWNITDKKETTALLMPGAAIKGGWKLTDLTEAGRFIREKLQALNPKK